MQRNRLISLQYGRYHRGGLEGETSKCYLSLYFLVFFFSYTVCPKSSDPFYMVTLLYKMGHYFLGGRYQYKKKYSMLPTIINNSRYSNFHVENSTSLVSKLLAPGSSLKCIYLVIVITTIFSAKFKAR